MNFDPDYYDSRHFQEIMITKCNKCYFKLQRLGLSQATKINIYVGLQKWEQIQDTRPYSKEK